MGSAWRLWTEDLVALCLSPNLHHLFEANEKDNGKLVLRMKEKHEKTKDATSRHSGTAEGK